MRGGWWPRPGRGHGQGILPDAHADFVFAVAAEEFGLMLCLILVALFAFIVLRGCVKACATTILHPARRRGLASSSGCRRSSTWRQLHLMPTKGMTLPFISYGGSSLLSLAWHGHGAGADADRPQAHACRREPLAPRPV